MGQMFAAATRGEGESVRAWKRRCIWAVAQFIARFALSFAVLSDKEQEQVVEVFEQWASEKEKVVVNPGHVIQLDCCGNLAPDDAMQMASEIIAGFCEWFLCRKIEKARDSTLKHFCSLNNDNAR